MNVSDAVESRRSVRAFRDTVVSYESLAKVLDKARMAPSGCNFQPWEAIAVTGKALRDMQTRMKGVEPQNPPEYDIQPENLASGYKERLSGAMGPVYEAAGISRDDAGGRNAFIDLNRTSYGAPVLLLVFIPRCMGSAQWADIGIWLQTVMLLLREEGLDSCPQEYMSLYAKLIKAEMNVTDQTHILFCGLAIGYRDEEASVNHTTRKRVPLDQQITFVGF